MANNFLYQNIRWQLCQNPHKHLLTTPTTEEQFVAQLENLANRYYPQSGKIDTLQTEFCLNKIALTRPKTPAQKVAWQQLRHFLQAHRRLQRLFGLPYMLFPCDGKQTRLEAALQLLTKCTQWATNGDTTQRLLNTICNTLPLTDREEQHLADVCELAKINYYCALCQSLLAGNPQATEKLAKFAPMPPAFALCTPNTCYAYAPYACGALQTVVDCFGNSALQLNNQPTHTSLGLAIYANGKNILDTFCNSKFRQNTAYFTSTSTSATVCMRYHLQQNCEIRQLQIDNTSKRANKILVHLPFGASNNPNAETFVAADGALCVVGANDIYVATAIVQNGKFVGQTCQNGLTYTTKLAANSTLTLHVATVCAKDVQTLLNTLNGLTVFGGTMCPHSTDAPHPNVCATKLPVRPTMRGYTAFCPTLKRATTLNFAYQMGNSNVATFVDNDGNSTTLCGGFVFGVGGESIYTLKGNLLQKVNAGAFCFDGDKLEYNNAHAKTTICHSEQSKRYCVVTARAQRTLVYLPFGQKSIVTKQNNLFTVQNDSCCLQIEFDGKVESYTTNALVCNSQRLRYKLDNNLAQGDCLAVCLAPNTAKEITITSATKIPKPTPIVRESLVSTYLNYVNDKNVFCLSNRLKRPDGLTLAAICYTNPQFVKQYVTQHLKDGGTFVYYDQSGAQKTHRDQLALALGCVYYQKLVGNDLPPQATRLAESIFLHGNLGGQQMCLQALALKQMAELDNYNKVACLGLHADLKRKICASAALLPYAQAVGALPLVNPSKERLKDLCNVCNLPKSWYYVSQLENLYGLKLVQGKLAVAPKVSAENVLEQFALFVDNKRIDTTFAKASVQSMTLNGSKCFQPFVAANLPKQDNQLVVRY